MIIVATSLLFMGRDMGRDDLSSIYLSFVIMGLGSMLFQSPINTEIMNTLSAEMLGAASSLPTAVRNMGMSMGASISTLLSSLQLNHLGYNVSIIDMKLRLISITIKNVMIITAALCILGAAVVFLRDRGGGQKKISPCIHLYFQNYCIAYHECACTNFRYSASAGFILRYAWYDNGGYFSVLPSDRK